MLWRMVPGINVARTTLKQIPVLTLSHLTNECIPGLPYSFPVTPYHFFIVSYPLLVLLYPESYIQFDTEYLVILYIYYYIWAKHADSHLNDVFTFYTCSLQNSISFRTFRNFYPTAIFVQQYPQKSKYFEICTYLK